MWILNRITFTGPQNTGDNLIYKNHTPGDKIRRKVYFKKLKEIQTDVYTTRLTKFIRLNGYYTYVNIINTDLIIKHPFQN